MRFMVFASTSVVFSATAQAIFITKDGWTKSIELPALKVIVACGDNQQADAEQAAEKYYRDNLPVGHHTLDSLSMCVVELQYSRKPVGVKLWN